VTPGWRLSLTAILAVAGTVALRVHASANDDSRWVVLTVDSGYTVAVDTSRIERQFGNTYRIWYRTDHDRMRFYKEKAFDRETVQAILRCDGYGYRVVSTEMSVRRGKTVIRQTTDDGELGRQPWHRVEAGSPDAIVAHSACEIARHRSDN
jgi:hypothetical protein